jgi:MFS superfamily sulfate permease-like transporter
MASSFSGYDKTWLPVDTAAGLVTAAVVIPKRIVYRSPLPARRA